MDAVMDALSAAGDGLRVFLGGAFVVTGLVVLAASALLGDKARRMRAWPIRRATVGDVRVEENGEAFAVHHTFFYQARGDHRVGDTAHHPITRNYANKRAAERAAYARGRARYVMVRVNPADPAEAYVDRPFIAALATAAALGLIFAAAGAFIAGAPGWEIWLPL